MPIDAVLIGNESLLIRCGQRLLDVGGRISLVVTEDPAVGQWAASAGLTHEPFDRTVVVRLGPAAVDYVLSIGNLRVLPAEWLALARRLAINFHDGPLPSYRGLHATSWALINREPRHGITWHVASPEVDRGEILEQELFDVAADETALTLNARCYEAGVRAFDRLLDAMLRGHPTRRAAAADGPSYYFGRSKRPRGAGYVDWRRPIDECDALIRALDFGPYANPLCSPWGLQRGQVVRVNRHAVDDVRAGRASAFDPLDAELERRISERHEEWCTAERAWVSRLAGLTPLDVVAGQRGDRGETAAPFEIDPALAGDPARVAAAIFVWLARAFDQPAYDVGFRGTQLDRALAGLTPWFEPLPPLRIAIDVDRPFDDGLSAALAALEAHDRHGSFLRDVVHRYPGLRGRSEHGLASAIQVAVTIGEVTEAIGDAGVALLIHVADDGRVCEWRCDDSRVRRPLEVLQRHCAAFLRAALASPGTPVWQLPVVTPSERAQLLIDWNPAGGRAGLETFVQQFEAQAARTPDVHAVIGWRGRLTYRELNGRANRLAALLQSRGIGRGSVVGIHLERSLDLVTAVVAVLKAGAAYLPLDPAYPTERIHHMVADSEAALVLTQSDLMPRLGPHTTPVLAFDALTSELAEHSDENRRVSIAPGDLIYVIYTSGSTGRPKGVLIEHGNVASFFAAMDGRIDRDPPGTWLAVTSLSFDISALELLWTLCRGFSVVVQENPLSGMTGHAAAGGAPIDLSLFYFASDENVAADDRYRLLMEGAKFADAHGFEAVWTPERHFHAFGGLYPNPAITSAAIASITSRIRIRAGSLVMPLHHPVRAAEDWSLVDNLSKGRVGVAFASGWHPNDFVFAPQHHAVAKQVTFEGLDTVRRLWRGETVTLKGPHDREVAVRTLPRPVQPELPFWITTAGNPDTFSQAGAIGGNLLTHLLGQTIGEVAAKIATYREARRAAGHQGPGQVTLMLHTFVGGSDEDVRELVRGPMKQYLGSSLNLVKPHAWSFPAFKGRMASADASTDELFRDLSAADLDALLDHSFDRYFETGGLFGSIDTCVAIVERLRVAGVDEIACLIDFGVPTDQVLSSLEALAAVRRRVAGPRYAGSGEPPVSAAIERYGVTHLQCTPSMAEMLIADAAGAAALGRLRHLLVGGEALPVPLASRLRETGAARITNMYGPTETTIWSLTHDLERDESPVPIGRPIAGTTGYVVDARGELVPIGVEGELYLGGPGVARGYHARPDLTAERFVPDRFSQVSAARLYRTGDRVRYRTDGVLEFLGRIDQQVKLRGHRIELGEIEAELRRVPGIGAAAVTLREDTPGDARLVAYVTLSGSTPPVRDAWQTALRQRMPDVMVPSSLVVLDALPLTPNGKVDRRALPRPDGLDRPRPGTAAAPPQDDLQRQVATIWKDVLHTESVGVDDNFFDLGGHSLLTLQIAHRLGKLLGRSLPITDLFRFPTIRGLARHLATTADGSAPTGLQAGNDRATARLAARARRREP